VSEVKSGCQVRAERLTAKTLRISYNYCGICGHTPKTNADEPNYAPIRWWDCDDGWKIGTLCHWCHDEVANAVPKPGDFAFERTNGVMDQSDTDEDETMALE
jgi:hypothetical protein